MTGFNFFITQATRSILRLSQTSHVQCIHNYISPSIRMINVVLSSNKRVCSSLLSIQLARFLYESSRRRVTARRKVVRVRVAGGVTHLGCRFVLSSAAYRCMKKHTKFREVPALGSVTVAGGRHVRKGGMCQLSCRDRAATATATATA